VFVVNPSAYNVEGWVEIRDNHLKGGTACDGHDNPPDNRMSVVIAEGQKESPDGRNGKSWAKGCPKIRKPLGWHGH
jgi:hypothetical protein